MNFRRTIQMVTGSRRSVQRVTDDCLYFKRTGTLVVPAHCGHRIVVNPVVLDRGVYERGNCHRHLAINWTRQVQPSLFGTVNVVSPRGSSQDWDPRLRLQTGHERIFDWRKCSKTESIERSESS